MHEQQHLPSPSAQFILRYNSSCSSSDARTVFVMRALMLCNPHDCGYYLLPPILFTLDSTLRQRTTTSPHAKHVALSRPSYAAQGRLCLFEKTLRLPCKKVVCIMCYAGFAMSVLRLCVLRQHSIHIRYAEVVRRPPPNRAAPGIQETRFSQWLQWVPSMCCQTCRTDVWCTGAL